MALAFLAGAFFFAAGFATAFFATVFFAAGLAGVAFLTAAFLATGFLAAGFLATAFFAGAFFGAVFFTAAFFATVFFVGAFFAGVFFGAAFLGAAFFAAAFFGVAFLATTFLGATFFVTTFFATFFAVAFLGATFFTAFLTVDFLGATFLATALVFLATGFATRLAVAFTFLTTAFAFLGAAFAFLATGLAAAFAFLATAFVAAFAFFATGFALAFALAFCALVLALAGAFFAMGSSSFVPTLKGRGMLGHEGANWPARSETGNACPDRVFVKGRFKRSIIHALLDARGQLSQFAAAVTVIGPICLTGETIRSFPCEGYGLTYPDRVIIAHNKRDKEEQGSGAMTVVEVEKNGPVTTVILNRPDVRNAVDRPTATALADAFLAFEKDDEALVAVFAGAHGTFCAGADLKAAAAGGSDSADGRRGNRIVNPGTALEFDRLASEGPMGPSRMVLSKPVIGAIAGFAVAGGLELALWCDMRVVEEDAVMGVFCRRWGVPLIDGGTVRLPRLIGHSRAMDLILTGRGVGADEALQMGLANRVVAKGTARVEAEKLAAEIARFPQNCLTGDRMSAYEQWDLPYDRAMANEFEHGRAVLSTGETVKGAARFAAGKGRGGRFDEI